MSARRWVSTRTFRPILALVLCAIEVACGGAPAKEGTHSSTAQSQAEYDIAVDLWVQRGQPRRALEHALNAVELDNDNPQAPHLVALLYLDFCNRTPEECRLDQAERHARRAVKLKSDFREANNTLAVVLIHQKRYAEAIEILRPLSADILYQTPENAWGNLGWALLESGDVEGAIDALSRSTAVQPNFCVGHYRLGLAYDAKGDFEAAVKAYTRALDVDHPRCRAMQDAYLNRARATLRLGRQDAAMEDLQRCVQLDKSTRTGRECSALLVSVK